MMPSKSSIGFRYCNPHIYRAVAVALALLPAGCDRGDQGGKTAPTQVPAAKTQAPAAAPAALPASAQPQSIPATAPPTPAAKPLTDLESLVAPIALYPDALLAEVLVASTYPLEVVQAARWLETKPDPAALSGKDWDASIMRLTSVPQVVKMMNDHLDWTTQLGDTFLAKPAELMDAVQTLRKRATDAGFLKDTPEQKVTAKTVSAAQSVEAESAGETIKATPAVLKKEVITIEPAKSDTVYVPQYNPESVYQAPLAAPPAVTGASYAYPAAAPSAGYYPTYYPPAAPATTTTSTTDSLLTFGAGALVGGLLTWGIMEWADDDDWDDDYHHVSHYYGDSVCNNGNCWHGGGGYNGDRGNINSNRNVNISGNEINVDRGGMFSQSNLRPAQRPAGWQPNPQHRRGQAYPAAVQQRLGRSQQPALAGQRLGAAQTLPAATRGFAEAGARPAAGTLPTQRRPSSAEIQQRLAQKPGAEDKLGRQQMQQRPATRDIQEQLGRGPRENALAGLRESGQAAGIESRRGAESRKLEAPATREAQGAARAQRSQMERPRQAQTRAMERHPEMPQQAGGRQAFQGRERSQQMDMQRRAEAARPSAFGGARDTPRATQNFSQRGAASRGGSAGVGNRGNFGGGGRSGGGGGGRRGGGGGRR